MVGIFSPVMLEIARFKAVSPEESSSSLSLTMIFNDTTLLGPAALFGVEGTVDKVCDAEIGAQENDKGMSVGEAAVAGRGPLEADVGEEPGITVEAAAAADDDEEAAVSVRAAEADVVEADGPEEAFPSMVECDVRGIVAVTTGLLT